MGIINDSTEKDELRGELKEGIFGKISFNEVSFSYAQRADIPVLKEVSFEINKNAFSYKNIITSYHIRCKLEDYGYPRFLESYNMLYLHKIQKNIQITTFTKKISILIFKIIKILNFKFYLNKYILRNRHLRNRLRRYKNILTRKSVG